MKLLLKFLKKNYIVVILFFVLLFSIYFLNKRFNIIEGLKKKKKAKKAKKAKKSKKPKKAVATSSILATAATATASVFGGTLGYSIHDDINNTKNTIQKINQIMIQDGISYSDKINSIKQMLDNAIIKDDTVKQIIDDGIKSINTTIYNYTNNKNSNLQKSLVEKINGILSQDGKSNNDKLNNIKFVLTDNSFYNKNIDKIIFDGEKDIIENLNTYVKLLDKQFTSS